MNKPFVLTNGHVTFLVLAVLALFGLCALDVYSSSLAQENAIKEARIREQLENPYGN
jgi:hypothetical protein